MGLWSLVKWSKSQRVQVKKLALWDATYLSDFRQLFTCSKPYLSMCAHMLR